MQLRRAAKRLRSFVLRLPHLQAKAQARLEKDAAVQMEQLMAQFNEFNEKMTSGKERAAAKAAHRKWALEKMKTEQVPAKAKPRACIRATVANTLVVET